MKKNLLKRIGVICLLLVMFMSELPSFAVWDGTGGVGEAGGTYTNKGYAINTTVSEALKGYRFNVFSYNSDGSGDLVGHGIDVYLSTVMINWDCEFFRNTNKNFRNDGGLSLNLEEVLCNGQKPTVDTQLSISGIHSKTGSFGEEAGNNEYMGDSFTNHLTTIEPASTTNGMNAWLSDDENRARILSFCGVTSLPTSGYYITVEPLFGATMARNRYVLTLAEYALYQASAYGLYNRPSGGKKEHIRISLTDLGGSI